MIAGGAQLCLLLRGQVAIVQRVLKKWTSGVLAEVSFDRGVCARPPSSATSFDFIQTLLSLEFTFTSCNHFNIQKLGAVSKNHCNTSRSPRIISLRS